MYIHILIYIYTNIHNPNTATAPDDAAVAAHAAPDDAAGAAHATARASAGCDATAAHAAAAAGTTINSTSIDICIYIYVYKHVHTHVCIHTYTCIFTSTNTWQQCRLLCRSGSSSKQVFGKDQFIYVFTGMCLHAYMYIHMHLTTEKVAMHQQ
jgi:hypothetical protein